MKKYLGMILVFLMFTGIASARTKMELIESVELFSLDAKMAFPKNIFSRAQCHGMSYFLGRYLYSVGFKTCVLRSHGHTFIGVETDDNNIKKLYIVDPTYRQFFTRSSELVNGHGEHRLFLREVIYGTITPRDSVTYKISYAVHGPMRMRTLPEYTWKEVDLYFDRLRMPRVLIVEYKKLKPTLASFPVNPVWLKWWFCGKALTWVENQSEYDRVYKPGRLQWFSPMRKKIE